MGSMMQAITTGYVHYSQIDLNILGVMNYTDKAYSGIHGMEDNKKTIKR